MSPGSVFNNTLILVVVVVVVIGCEANFVLPITVFSCESRRHFTEGKSITGRQYTIEMIK